MKKYLTTLAALVLLLLGISSLTGSVMNAETHEPCPVNTVRDASGECSPTSDPTTPGAFDPFGKVCDESTADSSVCQDNKEAKANPFNPISGKDGVLFTAVRILSSLVGVISVIMILFGSIKYITAGGEANSVASAKRTIIYALVGVLVAALAQGLIIFIVNSLN